MKKTLFVFLLFAVMMSAGAMFARGAATPEDTAKSFYKWYLHELNASREPINQKAKLRSFLSVRLNKWIHSKAYEDYGADYFISAQDFGEGWEHNIQVGQATIKGAAATLRVTLVQPETGSTPYMGNRVLDLKLIKESGVWKIDRITAKD